jgi:hypothetical protein
MVSPDLLNSFVSLFSSVDGEERAVQSKTERTALKQIYDRIPMRLPDLYEELILNYRWTRATVGGIVVFGNPRGDDFSGFIDEIFADRHLAHGCVANRFIPIGFGQIGNYDPLCFDTNRSRGKHNYPLVVLDHELALMETRAVVKAEIAADFEKLMRHCIEA